MDWKKDLEIIKQGSPLIIAVDFDDTLAKAGEKYPEIGESTYLLNSLIELKKILKGHLQIILWTCRDGEDLQMAIDYCKERGLEFDAINEDAPATLKWKPKTPKPFAHIYIDDRSLSFCDDDTSGDIDWLMASRLLAAVNDWGLNTSDKTYFGVVNGEVVK